MPHEVLNRLVPRPQEMRLARGCFEWTEGIILVIEPGNAADHLAAGTVVEHLRERGCVPPEIVATRDEALVLGRRQVLAGDPCRNWLLGKAMREDGVEIPPSLGTEGYVLCVTPRRILVAGISPEGVYYGLQTLAQLAASSCGTGGIPCVLIRDYPGVRQRGLLLDLASGQVCRPGAFRRLIRRMAHYKLNTLVLYLQDAFVYPSHPETAELRDRLTAADVEEMVSFARGHHLEIVPCLDSCARMGGMLEVPSMSHLSEGEAPPLSGMLNVAHPEAYPLLEELYGDLCRFFPAAIHCVGGDEAPGIGAGRSASAAAQAGRDTLYLRHIKMVRDILAGHGRRMAVPADAFEPGPQPLDAVERVGMEGLRQVPRDVVLVSRPSGEVQGFSFGESAREMGFDVQMWTPDAAGGRLYPAVGEAARNVQSFLQYAQRMGATGAIHSGRSAPGENTFFEYGWPAAAFFAEWAWSLPGRTWENAAQPVAESFYGPGCGRVADVVRFLGHLEEYFPWARAGHRPAGMDLFFGPVIEHRLGRAPGSGRGHSAPSIPAAEAEQRLAAFRHDLFAARDSLIQARIFATANVEHLDYLDFALEQYEALADLVELRHILSLKGPEARRRLVETLRRLEAFLPSVLDRYCELWDRTNLPLGLRPNRERFERVLGSVRECCDRESVRC